MDPKDEEIARLNARIAELEAEAAKRAFEVDRLQFLSAATSTGYAKLAAQYRNTAAAIADASAEIFGHFVEHRRDGATFDPEVIRQSMLRLVRALGSTTDEMVAVIRDTNLLIDDVSQAIPHLVTPRRKND